MGEGILIYGLSRTKKNRASEEIKLVFAEIQSNGYTKHKPFKIGTIGIDVMRFAQRKNITLGSKDIYITPKFFAHALRKSKGVKRVSKRDVELFPVTKRSMHKYYDGDSFIFTDFKIKFIIRPNYKIKIGNKNKQIVNLITAGKVTDETEFNLPKYEKIR